MWIDLHLHPDKNFICLPAVASVLTSIQGGKKKVREELSFSIGLTRRWLPVFYVLFKWCDYWKNEDDQFSYC